MNKQILNIILVVILSSSVSFAAFSQEAVLQGQISQVVKGEIDPVVFGDRCIVNVNATDGRLIGLVTDYDDCAANSEELLQGRSLTVSFDLRQKITSVTKLSLLQKVSAAQIFYNVEFGAIENGLSDLLGGRVDLPL